MCIINNICWKISLACQQKCGIQDMTFFHGFTNTREGYRAGNFTLLSVRIEKQRGKPFFQAPRQTRAEGTFWSSERPEVCCCGTGEHCCPFHPAQQTGCPDCPRGRRQRVAPEKFTVPPGASRDAAVLALRGRGAESWTRSWRAGEEQLGTLQVLPILLEPLTAHLRKLGICFRNSELAQRLGNNTAHRELQESVSQTG